MGAGSSASPPRHPVASKTIDSADNTSPVSVADAARRGTVGAVLPAETRGSAVAPSRRVAAMSPPGSQGEATLLEPGAHRPSLFPTPLQTHLEVVGPPRGLSFRVSQVPAGGPAGGDAGDSARGSLTPAAAPSPPKAQKAIRKPAKPRGKRISKKAAAALLAGGPAQVIQVPDGPPTAESQNGMTPLAAPPPVHPVGEPRAPPTVTVDAMTRVFAEGLRPVCVHLAGLRKKLDEVHTSVNRLSTSLHTQGVGNERNAQAVVQLQGAVKGVYVDVVGRVKKERLGAPTLRGSTAMLDDCAAQQELASINDLELSNVQAVAKKAMIQEMLGSTESYQAMPNRARSLEILYDACESVRGGSRDDSEAYLSSFRVFLTTAGTPTDKRIRVSEKLYRISSHVTEALQKVAMLAYFKDLGEDIDSMTPAVAAGWLKNGKYARSDKADPAINAALQAIFMRNGHAARVVSPKDVGDDVYVDASTGHVGLITYWAKGVFEKIAGIRKSRRTGNDNGAYDGWRAEVRHVSTFLRRHTKVKDGLRLCDGNDKRRAMLLADDGTFVVDESGDEQPESSNGSAGRAGSVEQEGDRSTELVPGPGGANGGEIDVDGEGLEGDAVDEWESADGWEHDAGEADVAVADGVDGAGDNDSADWVGRRAGLGTAVDVGAAVGVGDGGVVETPGSVAPAECADGGEPGDAAPGLLRDAAPGLLPESAAYPGGFAEYLEEVPL